MKIHLRIRVGERVLINTSNEFAADAQHYAKKDSVVLQYLPLYRINPSIQ